eukprot:6454508-Ditylum_brightwellii.AAC.1
MVYKYGIKVPQSVKHAFELDKANSNTMWQDTMALEVDALKEMKCFDFQDAGNKPTGNYQCTTLHMVFICKQDLRKKARIVAGGHLIDLLDNKVYSSTVNGISVKLLYVIAHCVGLKALCGDIVNAYVNAYTTERVYSADGPEFGEDLIRKIVVMRKALYITETVSRVERICGRLAKHDTPMVAGDLPEFNNTKVLDDRDH